MNDQPETSGQKIRTQRVRRARKPYPCDAYRHAGPDIQAGELYLYATSPPWDDVWATGTWDHIRACRRCAATHVEDFERSAVVS